MPDIAGLGANTTALAASLVVKASPGALYRVRGYNNKVSAQFIQIHDAAALPADAAVPISSISVPASTAFDIPYGERGRDMSLGIVVCNSSTLATKTIGAADCWIEALYA